VLDPEVILVEFLKADLGEQRTRRLIVFGDITERPHGDVLAAQEVLIRRGHSKLLEGEVLHDHLGVALAAISRYKIEK